jgi:hypothetical protein
MNWFMAKLAEGDAQCKITLTDVIGKISLMEFMWVVMANDHTTTSGPSHSTATTALFVGRAERDFVKQINDEVIEKVVGRTSSLFSHRRARQLISNFYGEAINKTFFPLVRVYSH